MTIDEDTGQGGRPGPARDDVLAELAVLRSALRDTDTIARKAAEIVSEVAPQVDDVAGHLVTLRNAVTKLMADASVAAADDPGGTAAEAELGLSDEPPGPWCWPLLDHQQASAAWETLARWIERVLVPQYSLTRRELPDCWARHSRMVAELSWLRHAYLEAHHAGAPAARAQDWHVRALPGALAAVNAAIPTDDQAIGDKRRALCGPGHHERPPPADRHEMRSRGEMLAAASCWTATWRQAREADLAARRPAR